jgi:hypothetical protein
VDGRGERHRHGTDRVAIDVHQRRTGQRCRRCERFMEIVGVFDPPIRQGMGFGERLHRWGEQVDTCAAPQVLVLHVPQHAIATIIEHDDRDRQLFLGDGRQLADLDLETAVADEHHRPPVGVSNSGTNAEANGLTDAAAPGVDVGGGVIDIEQTVAPSAVRDRDVTNQLGVARQDGANGVADLGIRADVGAQLSPAASPSFGDLILPTVFSGTLNVVSQVAEQLVENRRSVADQTDVGWVAAPDRGGVDVDLNVGPRQRQLEGTGLVATEVRPDRDEQIGLFEESGAARCRSEVADDPYLVVVNDATPGVGGEQSSSGGVQQG